MQSNNHSCLSCAVALVFFILFFKYLAIPVLILLFILWIISKLIRSFRTWSYNNTDFVKVTFTLLGYVACRSSSDEELQYFIINNAIEDMKLNQENTSSADNYVRLGMRISSRDMELLIKETRRSWKSSNNLERILNYVGNILFSDNKLTRQEIAVFADVSRWFELPMEHVKNTLKDLLRVNGFVYDNVNDWFTNDPSFRSSSSYGSEGADQGDRYQNNSSDYNYEEYRSSSSGDLDKAYKILGINASTSDNDAKKAYKKMMMRYHPDRAIAKGLGEDGVKRYTELSQQIQEAWSIVKKYRHIS